MQCLQWCVCFHYSRRIPWSLASVLEFRYQSLTLKYRNWAIEFEKRAPGLIWAFVDCARKTGVLFLSILAQRKPRGRWGYEYSVLKTDSINAPKRLKLCVSHCKLLNYLNWNLGISTMDKSLVSFRVFILRKAATIFSCQSIFKGAGKRK